jgi:hypothetical protein
VVGAPAARLTNASIRLSLWPVTSPDEESEGVVPLAVQPFSRTWSAAWLGLGVALLLGAVLLALGETFASLRQPVLDALIGTRLP